MARTWILTGSPENHAATRAHGFAVIGLREHDAARERGHDRAAPSARAVSRSIIGRLSTPGGSCRRSGGWPRLAALGLVVTLFLPWYQETVITAGVGTKFALPSAR